MIREEQPQTATRVDKSLDALIRYTVSRNPQGIRRLIYRYGYRLPGRGSDIVEFIYRFLKLEGSPGFDDLVREHPDRELLAEIEGLSAPTDGKASPEGFDSFMPEEETPMLMPAPVDVAQLIAFLASERKKEVVDLLNRHGRMTLYSVDTFTLGNVLVEALCEHNSVLGRELVAIADEESRFMPQLMEAVGQVANAAGKTVGGGKRIREQLKADSTMALINRNQEKEQQRQENRKITLQYVSIGLAALLILVGLVVFARKSKQ
jgi:hypothetical protein